MTHLDMIPLPKRPHDKASPNDINRSSNHHYNRIRPTLPSLRGFSHNSHDRQQRNIRQTQSPRAKQQKTLVIRAPVARRDDRVAQTPVRDANIKRLDALEDAVELGCEEGMGGVRFSADVESVFGCEFVGGSEVCWDKLRGALCYEGGANLVSRCGYGKPEASEKVGLGCGPEYQRQ
jgi:hypothetical protein